MLFMAAMLGIVLSDNLLLLVVFWELTSISSFLLVGYWGHKAEARAGARMALAVTGGGGLALLAGVVLLGQIAGSYDLSEMLGRGAEIQATRCTRWRWADPAGLLHQERAVPFHFWLPEAMAAPTPVSAYLHSATMVKAGMFLMLRLYPVLGGTALFEGVVASVGPGDDGVRRLRGGVQARPEGAAGLQHRQPPGLITFLIGLASPLSAVAAVFHILNHAAFKAALFMSAGIVDHETGTRDMRRLGGLMALLPWTGHAGAGGRAAMAGVPPQRLHQQGDDASTRRCARRQAACGASFGWLVPVLATLGGICSRRPTRCAWCTTCSSTARRRPAQPAPARAAAGA
jgi:multicomponent K+:H+ antiporter subunit A